MTAKKQLTRSALWEAASDHEEFCWNGEVDGIPYDLSINVSWVKWDGGAVPPQTRQRARHALANELAWDAGRWYACHDVCLVPAYDVNRDGKRRLRVEVLWGHDDTCEAREPYGDDDQYDDVLGPLRGIGSTANFSFQAKGGAA